MEYAYETAKIARQVGFFNTFVTNGYMTPEAVKTIAPVLDAATVDFKGGGDPEFYKSVSAVPTVEPIYEALKELEAERRPHRNHKPHRSKNRRLHGENQGDGNVDMSTTWAKTQSSTCCVSILTTR